MAGNAAHDSTVVGADFQLELGVSSKGKPKQFQLELEGVSNCDWRRFQLLVTLYPNQESDAWLRLAAARGLANGRAGDTGCDGDHNHEHDSQRAEQWLQSHRDQRP